MNFFAFSYSSLYSHIKTFWHLTMQLLIFSIICQQTNSSGSSMENRSFGCYATKCSSHFRSPFSQQQLGLVGSNGLGPSTSRLSGVCSNQLSYEPVLVEVIGFEPMTPCLQGRCSTSWAIPPLSPRSSPLGENKCPPFSRKAYFIKNE